MTAHAIVELRRHADLRPIRDGDVLVTASVGPDNTAVMLWSTPAGAVALRSRTEQAGWASFPDPAPPALTSAYLMAMGTTGFPVVRITDSVVTSWPGPATSARALIVAGTRCALIDGTKQPRILVGDLSHGHFQRHLLGLPKGQRLPRNARFIARGPDLHVITDTAWYRLTLDDVP